MCERELCIRFSHLILLLLLFITIYVFYSSCAHGCASEFRYCDMHIKQLLNVIGITLEQTPRDLALSKPLGELPCNGVS